MNGLLGSPAPFEASLLGQASRGAGQGLQSTLEHTWPFAPWLALLLLIVAALYVIVIYARESAAAGRWRTAVMAGLRIALIGLLVLMLYGWMRHRHITDLPDLVIILDDSQSMALVDHYRDGDLQSELLRRVAEVALQEPSRLNVAKSLLLTDNQRLLRALDQRYNLKLYLVGSSARVQVSSADQTLDELIRSIEPTEPVSQLGSGLRDVLEAQRGRPTAAIVMFSDGITTQGRSLSEAAQYARRKQIPLYLVGLGNEETPRDVRLDDLLVEELVFVDDVVHFDFKLTSSGLDGQPVTVRLKRADNGEVLEQKRVMLDEEQGAQAVRLSHRPQEEGEFEYIVESMPLPGEINSENNSKTALVSVRDETIRVLLVQEYPSFEWRFLKTMLERSRKGEGPDAQKAIELTTILQEGDLEYTQQDETAERVFPVQKEELFQYDVLIFGDVNPVYLSQSVMQNIGAFVQERGGGVVFMAGPRHTPLAYRDTVLADLLPINLDTAAVPASGAALEEPISVEPTTLGLSSPQMQLADSSEATRQLWRSLPPIYWLMDAPELRPGALVLAEQVGSADARRPVICMQFVGAGKVIFHGTDETYRWSRYRGSDQYYQRYWLQSIRYLSRSKLLGQSRSVEMTTDRDQYRRGDAVRLRVRFFDDRQAPAEDDGVTLVLEREGGKRRYVQLQRDATNRGIFEATVTDLPDGDYRVWLADPTLEEQPTPRRFQITAPPGEQARLEMNAGELRQAANISSGRFYTLSDIRRLASDLPPGRQVRIQSLPPEPLWNSPWLAGLFLTLIVSEWLLRKRSGLL